MTRNDSVATTPYTLMPRSTWSVEARSLPVAERKCPRCRPDVAGIGILNGRRLCKGRVWISSHPVVKTREQLLQHSTATPTSRHFHPLLLPRSAVVHGRQIRYPFCQASKSQLRVLTADGVRSNVAARPRCHCPFSWLVTGLANACIGDHTWQRHRQTYAH